MVIWLSITKSLHDAMNAWISAKINSALHQKQAHLMVQIAIAIIVPH